MSQQYEQIEDTVPLGVMLPRVALEDSADQREQYQSVPFSAEAHMAQFSGEVQYPSYNTGWAEQDKFKGTEPERANEDATYQLYDEEHDRLTIAVFDGLGGHLNGAVASMTARQELHRLAREDLGVRLLRPLGRMKDYLDAGHAAITALGEDVKGPKKPPATTALIAIIENNPDSISKKVHVAAVGDSLGFIFHPNGRVTALNREETQARQAEDELNIKVPGNAPDSHTIVTNSLGANAYNSEGLKEKRTFNISDGDIIVLTTDGITGDLDRQSLDGVSKEHNAAIIAEVVNDPNLSPKEKAEKLVAIARKHDDRSCVVVEVGTRDRSRKYIQVGMKAIQA